jgi:hypothetical protein
MEWYVELTLQDGTIEKMYCTSREEARYKRRWYLHYTTQGESNSIVKATVRRVP